MNNKYKPNYLEIGKAYDDLLEEKEDLYEAVAGDSAINRYTHYEMRDLLLDLYDTSQESDMLANENVNFAKYLTKKCGFTNEMVSEVATTAQVQMFNQVSPKSEVIALTRKNAKLTEQLQETKDNLESAYEAVYGDMGIERFSHIELLERLLELYDAEKERDAFRVKLHAVVYLVTDGGTL